MPKVTLRNNKTAVPGFVVVKVRKNGVRSVRPYTFAYSSDAAMKAVCTVWKTSRKEIEKIGYRAVPATMEIDYSKY